MSETAALGERAVRLFISYAHQDDYYLKALKQVLTFPGVTVQAWHDKDIKPGERWDEGIRAELRNMDIFIPLISVHFAVSSYIREVECPIAKERHDKREIEIIPVLIYDPGGDECDWLMELQRVPPNRESWAEIQERFGRHDMALAPIRRGIREVVDRTIRRPR